MVEHLIEQLRAFRYPPVRAGHAFSAYDFAQQLVYGQFADTHAIETMHRDLMRWFDSPNPVVFVRPHGDGRDNHMRRRGFVTRYGCGTELVFCDSTLSMAFHTIKLAGLNVQPGDLQALVASRRMQPGARVTPEERAHALYPSEEPAFRADLTEGGWHMVHLVPVNAAYRGYHPRDLAAKIARVCSLGEFAAWDNPGRVRAFDEALSAADRKVLKAHFLRLVHPLNAFLVPQPKLMHYHRHHPRIIIEWPIGRTDIGQERELLDHVAHFLALRFPEAFLEFRKAALAEAPAPPVPEVTMTYPFFLSSADLLPCSDIRWQSAPPKRRAPAAGGQSPSASPVCSAEQSLSSERRRFVQAVQMRQRDLDHLREHISIIGKAAFLQMYDLIASEPDIAPEALMAHISREEPMVNGPNRCMAAIAIFRSGHELEAVRLIATSKRLDEGLRQRALDYLAEAGEEVESS